MPSPASTAFLRAPWLRLQGTVTIRGPPRREGAQSLQEGWQLRQCSCEWWLSCRQRSVCSAVHSPQTPEPCLRGRRSQASWWVSLFNEGKPLSVKPGSPHVPHRAPQHAPHGAAPHQHPAPGARGPAVSTLQTPRPGPSPLALSHGWSRRLCY